MVRPHAFTLWLPLLLVACAPTDGATDTADKPPVQAVESPAEKAASAAAVAHLRAQIASLEASPEHHDEEVEVQHILIAFEGAQNADVTRTKEEAEALAAAVFARVVGGEDFTVVMKEYSTDPGPGTYPMTTESRGGMVAGFGNVGWRLLEGQIGTAPYDPGVSPFGWHIIKRLK